MWRVSEAARRGGQAQGPLPAQPIPLPLPPPSMIVGPVRFFGKKRCRGNGRGKGRCEDWVGALRLPCWGVA